MIMPQGTVETLKESYGFIRCDDDRPDLFFHRLDLVDLVFDERLIEQRVQFEQVDSPKGPRAKNVRPAD